MKFILITLLFVSCAHMSPEQKKARLQNKMALEVGCDNKVQSFKIIGITENSLGQQIMSGVHKKDSYYKFYCGAKIFDCKKSIVNINYTWKQSFSCRKSMI